MVSAAAGGAAAASSASALGLRPGSTSFISTWGGCAVGGTGREGGGPLRGGGGGAAECASLSRDGR